MTHHEGRRALARSIVNAGLLLAGWHASAAAQVMDTHRYLFLMADRLEQAPSLAGSPVRLDAVGWYGGDYQRLWVRIEGEAETGESAGEAQGEAFFGTLISPYWDLLVGMKVNTVWGEQWHARPHVAVGVQGLAPYWFEVEATAYASLDGEVSASVTAAYDVLITQRLIIEPRIETHAAIQAQRTYGIGSGINDLETGLRARYELRREFAPYVGVTWIGRFGETAELTRMSGVPAHGASVVLGLRAWH